MNEVAPPHYKSFLEREYQSRLRKNSGYSLRAFARDIGMPASKLSEVLRGLRGMSKPTAQRVSRKIGLSENETDLFLNLVDLHQSRNLGARKIAEEKLKGLALQDGYGELSLERFKIISEWHHLAILEMTELEGFEHDPSWMAGRLGVKTELVKEALQRLQGFGLLEMNAAGHFRQTHQNLATPSGIPSREIREHHSQILMKADQALENVAVSERDFSAMTLAFHSEQIDEIRAEIKNFRRKLGQRIQETPIKDRVYCLSVQFFPLDQIKKRKEAK